MKGCDNVAFKHLVELGQCSSREKRIGNCAALHYFMWCQPSVFPAFVPQELDHLEIHEGQHGHEAFGADLEPPQDRDILRQDGG